MPLNWIRIALFCLVAAFCSAQSTPTADVPVIPAKDATKMVCNKVRPSYPAEAKRNRVQGSVWIKVLVGIDGRVQNLRVTSGPQELRQVSAEAVAQWTYQPLIKDGQPTPFITDVEMNFAIF